MDLVDATFSSSHVLTATHDMKSAFASTTTFPNWTKPWQSKTN